nr:RHS repeat-associated core domain-containing protein [uncultured Desulfobacter sp.]
MKNQGISEDTRKCNNDFRPTAMTYAGGTENLDYDADGLLTSSSRFSISRNIGNGLPESVSDGTFSLTRSFNGYGETSGYNFSISGNNTFSLALTRNDGSRITHKTESIEGTSSGTAYTYDDRGQLLTVTTDGTLVEEYRYDNNGNRTYEMNRLRDISGKTFSYSNEDHIISAGTVQYTFDPDDRLSSRTDGLETTEYAYSSTGELMQVTLPDGTAITYTNDPLGRRIARAVNGSVKERYLWSGLTTLLAVYDGSATLYQRFIYADDRMPYAMKMNGSTYYLIYDQVGSLRLVTDSAGNSVKRIDYDTFGNVISDSDESLTVPFGFAGGLHDRATTLVRFGHRDYMPEIGKWTAKDPILFAGGDTNLYGYVLNDPVNLIDPLGLFWFRQDWQKPGQVGRPDTIVPPGGIISETIEKHLPAGYTFGQIHDLFVGFTRDILGAPDELVNIPSMIPMMHMAVWIEFARSQGVFDQPKPQSLKQENPCK